MPKIFKSFICLLSVFALVFCLTVPTFAADSTDSSTTESVESTTEDMNLWDYFKNFFESIDLSPVLDFLSSAWDGVTNFFGLFEAVSNEDGPFGWLE